MTQRFKYLCNAATTTAVTVVPSSRALATAARHTSSGIRNERGMVAMAQRPRAVWSRVMQSSHSPARSAAASIRPLSAAALLLPVAWYSTRAARYAASKSASVVAGVMTLEVALVLFISSVYLQVYLHVKRFDQPISVRVR